MLFYKIKIIILFPLLLIIFFILFQIIQNHDSFNFFLSSINSGANLIGDIENSSNNGSQNPINRSNSPNSNIQTIITNNASE